MPLPGHFTHPSHEPPQNKCPAASSFDALRQWSASRLHQAHRVGPIPLAGSPTWRALDDTDPRKTAAVLNAALAWLYECTPAVIADRLCQELDLIDRCHADRMNAVATEVSSAADWTKFAAGPRLRELTWRRTTFPCPACRISLRFSESSCAACGWVEPTPEQRREAARRSWKSIDGDRVGEMAA